MHLNDFLKDIKRIDTNEEIRRSDKISGRDWLKYSISIWDDIKTKEEKVYNHPASFPVSLVYKLIRVYTKSNELVLDPFMGIGSTLVAASQLNRNSIGFEICEDYINISLKRLQHSKWYRIINNSCLNIDDYLQENTVDLCITSPPYWNILSRKRTADNKEIRNYSNKDENVGEIRDYEQYLSILRQIFEKIYRCLKHEKHCIVIIMDIRKKSKFYPLHIDLTTLMKDIGFQLEDFVIWDRRKEYNNLKPLGYPWVFRVNKVHEYICIFKKPGVTK